MIILSNSLLKELLTEYERKRNSAIKLAEQKKEELYLANPRLDEIDNSLSKFSIFLAKLKLSSNSKKEIDKVNKEISKLKEEKNSILSLLNVDSSYFLPKYECTTCEDTGYITKNYSTTMCNCLKQKLFDIEYNTLNTYNIQNQTFDNFSDDIYSNKIDKEKYNMDISPKENIKLIKKIIINFINNFDNVKEKNLLFTGNSGLGKTFLSNCIANELLKKGKTVLYQTAPIMLDSIIDYKLRKVYL